MKVILILLTLFISSCQKQSPSGVDPDYTDSLSEVRRGESCRKVNLLQDIFELENLQHLFVCTTWEKTFPRIYEALLDLEPEDWNHIATPLNTHFFNDRELRDKSISLLRELDRKEGLDELGKVITSLSDSNFFLHVNLLFECVDNEACQAVSGVTRPDLLAFYEFFKADTELLEALVVLMRSFSTSLKGQGQSFKKSLTENLKNESFVYSRNNFLSELFLRMGDEDFLDELSFYESALFQQNDNTRGWLPTYIVENLSKDEFNYLNRYPVDTQKTLWKDFRILRKTLEVTVGCKAEDGTGSFKVDISTHMTNFIEILFSSTQEEFFRNSLQSVAILKAANEVCPELRGYKDEIQGLGGRSVFLHEINFVTMMELTTRLMLNEKYYSIIRKLHDSRPSKEIDNNTFLIKFFSEDTFTSYVEMLKAATVGSTGLSSSLYDVVQSFPSAGYPALKRVFEFVKTRPQEQLKSIQKVWNLLGEEGRYFFFNFLDAHYTKDANLSLLFDFYAAMVLNAKESIPAILSEIIDSNQEDVFFKSFRNLTKVLGRGELLEEYRRFFSREHLLEMIRVISTGSSTALAGASLGSYILEEVESESPYRLSTELVSDNVTRNCLKSLVKEETTFYSLLNELPVDCLPLRGEDPLFKLFYETANMAYFIGENQGTPKVFSKKGFFAPEMVTNVTQLLNVLSKRYEGEAGGSGEGLSVLLNDLDVWLAETNRKSTVVEAFRALPLLSKEKHDFLGVFSRFYGVQENFNFIKNLTGGISEALSLYDNYDGGQYNSIGLTKRDYVVDPHYKCESFHKPIGGSPCPSKEQLKAVILRIIERALKKNDENPKAIEQLVKMVATDYGLPIPFESVNPEFKRVTLEESFRMFYNFTDPDIKTNQATVEYRPIPKADEEYFKTKDWEVTKKQTKGAPDPFETTMNTMERIEVVIRDVRFDENYLGAHYLNSVAKADDYDKVVDSKYGLLKTCIPLKFCGKFMNKGQHKFAKNSKETFPSLLDVNTKEGWRHGKYMQALLTSLVSSSPVKSQLSTIVNKRIFGLNIKIPWLNSKKTLEHHNGKILGLVSMVGMFTNSARVLRDRVGRTPEDFQSFLNSERLRRTDEGMLRNFSTELHLPPLETLLNKLKESDILDEFLNFTYQSDYSTQRLWEQLLFKGVYLSSYLSESNTLNRFSVNEINRYKNLSLLDYIDVLNVIIDNYKPVADVFELSSKSTLLNLNHLMDVLMIEVENQNDDVIRLIHEGAYFVKFNKEELNKYLMAFLNEENLRELKLSLSAGQELAREVVKGDSNRLLDVLVTLEKSNEINWAPLQKFLKANGALNICSEETTGYYCKKNPEYRELQNIIEYVFGQSAQGFSKILSYITGAKKSAINQFFTKVFPSINTTP